MNESVGEYPVAVFADKDTRVIHVFLRSPQPGLAKTGYPDPQDLPDQLTFEIVKSTESAGAQEIRDPETGSIWDIEIGIATSGPLKGALLQRAPYVSAYYWAWEDFNPHTQFWGDRLDELE